VNRFFIILLSLLLVLTAIIPSIAFAIDTAYTITASAGTGGSISPSGTITANSGDNSTFTITPDSTFAVADVLVDSVSVGAVTSYTFTNITDNHTITASFVSTITSYTITASAGTGGSISPSGAITTNSGDNVTFTITPGGGYNVAVVLVDGSSVGAVTSYIFTSVTNNHSISASFSAITTSYTITASAGANGSIDPPGAIIVNSGDNATFTVTPSGGYNVADVLVDGSSVGAVTSYIFTSVTNNHSISASFSAITTSYIITASAGTGGSISPSGPVPVNSGDNLTFTITPDGNYAVADVLVDGSSVAAVTSHTFTNITDNHTIAARFASTITSYIITSSAGANGSISPSGAISVNSGATQAFSITPSGGFNVSDVRIDGLSIGTPFSYTFTNVTDNHSIAASFASAGGTVGGGGFTGGGGGSAPNLPGSTSIAPYTNSYGFFNLAALVKSEDGRVSLDIRQGVLAQNADATPLRSIKIVPVEKPADTPQDYYLVSLVYEITPERATFSPTIKLTVIYDSATLLDGTDLNSLRLAYFNRDTLKWEILSGIVDTYAKAVSTDISHFSVYALLGKKAVPPSTTTKPVPTLTPAQFSISDLILNPQSVTPGQTITVSAKVTNDGETGGSYDVNLKVNGVVASALTVTLAGRTSSDVTFSISRTDPGNFEVDVNGLKESFTVQQITPTTTAATQTPLPQNKKGTNWYLTIIDVAGGIVLGLGILFLIIKRNR
jgi:DNA gyrase inhibitor GyrI